MNNDLLLNLNPDQQEAVMYTESPLLIIAGAGSGKTRVITHKIAWLIREKGLAPYQILGVTFTNKAANEMKERICHITGLDAKLFHISTFHSFGLRILRQSTAISGYDATWQIMDESDHKKIMLRIVKDTVPNYSNEILDKAKRKISLAKMNLHYPNNPDYLLQKGFNSLELKIYQLYYQYQKENHLWDYEDLVSIPVKLMQANPELRQQYAEKFKYVLVDEFQDTNPNQYQLIRLIASPHQQITIVGDDDQAIYSWRGASIRFLSEFENDFPNSQIIKLEQNYRSQPPILDFANHIIQQNNLRKQKNMWTEKKAGNPVFFLYSRSKEEEAHQAAEFILHYRETCPELFPVAILYRINSQSLAFETEFNRRRINFRILKGMRFFERKEVKDSMALLRLAMNLQDVSAFLRLIDFLPLGIGEKTLIQLESLKKSYNLTYLECLQQHMPDKFNSKPIFGKIMELNTRKHTMKFSEILKILLEESGYTSLFETKGEDYRLLNIEELTGFIENWEKQNPDSQFDQLLDAITLDSEDRSEEKDNCPVFLLTMHNAKGLEFPTVIVAGVNSSYLPFFLRKEFSEIEEERRLFYVASTRAEKQLIISSGSDKESPFMKNIPRSLFSLTYSPMEIINSLNPQSGETATVPAKEERYVEHPMFGKGKIVNCIDQHRMIIDFVQKGEKVIDTSIVAVKYL
jgi:DNA helicase-2/ATP-dependent DNA helicase PcrA